MHNHETPYPSNPEDADPFYDTFIEIEDRVTPAGWAAGVIYMTEGSMTFDIELNLTRISGLTDITPEYATARFLAWNRLQVLPPAITIDRDTTEGPYAGNLHLRYSGIWDDELYAFVDQAVQLGTEADVT